MITEEEYLKAKAIVEEYTNLAIKTHKNNRVKLSAWGIEMQQPKKKNKTGTVINRSLAGTDDYYVEVKWDNQILPVWMHESQVEYID